MDRCPPGFPLGGPVAGRLGGPARCPGGRGPRGHPRRRRRPALRWASFPDQAVGGGRAAVPAGPPHTRACPVGLRGRGRRGCPPRRRAKELQGRQPQAGDDLRPDALHGAERLPRPRGVRGPLPLPCHSHRFRLRGRHGGPVGNRRRGAHRRAPLRRRLARRLHAPARRRSRRRRARGAGGRCRVRESGPGRRRRPRRTAVAGRTPPRRPGRPGIADAEPRHA